jgi:hypothetical protein
MSKLTVTSLAALGPFLVCAAFLQGCTSQIEPTDDAGDSGVDSGYDAGPDAGPDGGPDAGIDAGTDGGLDSGIDAGLDAGPDAGPDAGLDAGTDGGPDAGIDAGLSAPYFGTPVVSAVDQYMGQMATADFNGDGHLDLVVSQGGHTYNNQGQVVFAGNSVKVLFGNGDGTFQSPISLATQLSPHGVAVMDVDGDGLPDVVVGVCQTSSNHVTYFLNLGGDAGFALGQNVASSTCPYSLAVIAGLSGNGRPGLAAAGPGPYTLSGGGYVDTLVSVDGGLQLAGTLTTTASVTGIASADFNADGTADLAAATSTGMGTGNSALVVWVAMDGGRWQNPTTTLLDHGTYRAMNAGDIDGDGKVDIALVSSDTATLAVLNGNGDGTFGTPNYQGVTDPPVDVVMGNFSRSGSLDVAMATVGQPFIGLTVFPGVTAPTTVGSERRVLSDGTGYGIAQGDFDGDGLIDIALSLRDLDAVAVIPSLARPPFLPDPVTYHPADHTPIPPVVYNGGPVINAPQLITITYQDDTNATTDQQFDEWIVGSSWLTTIGADYGVSTGSNSNIVLHNNAPTSILDSDIQSMLVALIADGGIPAPVVPDGGLVPQQLYMVYFPYGTTISGDQLGTSCQSFGAYHNEDGLGSTPFAYAVMPTCDPYSPYYQEVSASHELAEATSDPLVQSAPAYTSTGFNNGWIGEIGDLCTPYDTYYLVDGGSYYAVQRIWSNSAVDAGTQPCIPAATIPFAAMTPDGGALLPNVCGMGSGDCTSVFAVSAGATYDLSLTGWINEPSVAAAVLIYPYGVASLIPVDFNPTLSMDTYNFHNGDVAHLTVTIPQGTPSQSLTVFTIVTGFDNDNYGYWPIVLFVE